jgi:hypothetical protein
MTTPLLQVRNLRAGYGKAEVLHGIDLSAAKGSVITVIGPNGAGKSTLLNTLMGILPGKGTIEFGGQDIGTLTLEERVMAGIALVPEKRELFGTMPVEDNLLLGGFRQMRMGNAQWRARLADSRKKVGLVWSGRPQHTNDRNRSCRLENLLPLLRQSGIHFVGLQKGVGSEQVASLPPDIAFTNLGDELDDFSDTAALLANMDLLISVDTAVVHLAGAMGRPAWVMIPFIPDWRWGMRRENCLWYPSLRLFRQNRPKDWSGVVECMRRELLDSWIEDT